MAAVTESAERTLHATTASTTAETWALTKAVKSVRVTNHGISDIYVTLHTSTQSSTDDAGITTAVALADETFVIPGATTSGSWQTREIFRSPRSTFVKGSIIGNTSLYSIEGFDWF